MPSRQDLADAGEILAGAALGAERPDAMGPEEAAQAIRSMKANLGLAEKG